MPTSYSPDYYPSYDVPTTSGGVASGDLGGLQSTVVGRSTTTTYGSANTNLIGLSSSVVGSVGGASGTVAGSSSTNLGALSATMLARTPGASYGGGYGTLRSLVASALGASVAGSGAARYLAPIVPVSRRGVRTRDRAQVLDNFMSYRREPLWPRVTTSTAGLFLIRENGHWRTSAVRPNDVYQRVVGGGYADTVTEVELQEMLADGVITEEQYLGSKPAPIAASATTNLGLLGAVAIGGTSPPVLFLDVSSQFLLSDGDRLLLNG